MVLRCHWISRQPDSEWYCNEHSAASVLMDKQIQVGYLFRNGNRTYKADGNADLHDRSRWCLVGLKDTPNPGVYYIRDFIEEAHLNSIRKTYGFKSTGRKRDILGLPKGDLLLPGAYDLTDSTQEVLKRKMSYSFKTCPRPDIVTLGIRDKQIDTSPCHYNVAVKPVEKIPCNHVMFRSRVQRITFPPKEGPAPGVYNPPSKPAKGITSSFKSKLPRLHSVHSITPGPGAHEPRWKSGDRLSIKRTVEPRFSLLFRHTP
ncbi:protein STPG4 [Dunckerocampus dactyliophorus]|uniref:protein STPG4 n=1 Tax=Dunckerocampus dactyliophorus TaxID=161453 RepID=UPI0024072DC8|nr:protein STPG4 [Dunckerocampus dactyliophorus]